MKILSILLFYIILHSPGKQTESPHGPDFKIKCSTCHSSKGWELDKQIYSFDHDKTKMPLRGEHQQVNCKLCHPTLVFSQAKSECISCHNDIHQSTVGSDCARCHTPASWLVKNINEIHQLSRFPLIGPHRTADCQDCHKSENKERFDVPGINCVDCHRQNFQATTNPNHILAGFTEECLSCHPLKSFQWSGVGYNHGFFPLINAHATPKCIDCHKSGRYADQSPDCFSCHEKDYLSTTNPDHNVSGYSKTCSDCHTLSPGWKPANFNHSSFPLTLGHANARCSDCHTGGNYTNTPTDCNSCHQKDYLATTNPNHGTSGFSINCLDCHTTNPAWKPAIFNHSMFPLTLGHSTPACIDCHNGNYTSTPTDCNSCHQKDFLATTNPNHSASGFSVNCQDCHTTNPGWKPSTFDHSSFPLTQGHAIPKCADCHTSGNYTSLPIDCYSCHKQNFQTTTDPNHVSSGFSINCLECHTTNPGWSPTTFNHNQFPLTLGHSVPKCMDCHKGNYTTTPSDCYSCHKQDFASTVDPNHSTSGFSINCLDCHTTNPGWKPTTFNHNMFPLTLGHASPQCADCHKGNYTNLASDCYSCHKQDFNATVDPNHSTSGFSINCLDCHTTNPGWKPTTFNHNMFPLTLGHATPQCADCHKGNYTNLASDCYSCHKQDFNATVDPNHSTSGFSINCLDCHTTNPGWKPTTFNHSSFPLTLGHAGPGCADCHKGNYTSTSRDCYSCHLSDYNATINPNHRTLGFSTTCSTCHTTNPDWKPASYTQHDSQFPIYSGQHRGQWSSCTDCHTNPANYSAFSCITCHEHNKTDMDSKHRGRSGYSYDSQACFSCHPRGNS